jgi:hypothetical protein
MIGLLAAYLVALQALILPVSMPPTAALADSLCLTEGTGGPAHHPAGPDHGCPCCAGCGMQCAAPALADAPPVLPLPPQAKVVAVAVPAPLAMTPRPAPRSPQMPRGPPIA